VKNKGAKVQNFPEMARLFRLKTGEKLKYCHFVSFFLLAQRLTKCGALQSATWFRQQTNNK
jgi:hypothetical protein